jgi:hypothetical protein
MPVSSDYDKVTQASLNGIYVKARELDRGHNDKPAPDMLPPGAFADAQTAASDAQSHASDAESHASDAESHASDAESHASDAQSHASDSAAASS